MRRLLLICALLAPGCAGTRAPAASASSPLALSTRGTVEEARDGGRVLVVAHDEIPGYMRAMSMPFEVTEAARDATLRRGDAIEFTFEERDERRVIVRLVRR